MKRALILVLGAALSLSSCASNGQIASKTNPVDYGVTLTRVCAGIQGMDAVFQGVKGAGLVDAKGVEVEAAALALVQNFCDPAKPPTDLPGAIAALAASMVDLGDLIAASKK